MQQLRGRLVDQLCPVRETGERVVQRVVAQPTDEHLVVQGDRGVVGDGLQQLQVVGREATHLTQAVMDGDGAHHAAVVAQRCEQRLAGMAHPQIVGAGLVVATQQQGFLRLEQLANDLAGLLGLVRRQQLRPAAHAAPRGNAGLVEAHDLGGLAAQQVARLGEHTGQDVVRLRARH